MQPRLPADRHSQERPRLNIPGSTWLLDTGYGALPPSMEDYLRANLARLTGGDFAGIVSGPTPSTTIEWERYWRIPGFPEDRRKHLKNRHK